MNLVNAAHIAEHPIPNLRLKAIAALCACQPLALLIPYYCDSDIGWQKCRSVVAYLASETSSGVPSSYRYASYLYCLIPALTAIGASFIAWRLSRNAAFLNRSRTSTAILISLIFYGALFWLCLSVLFNGVVRTSTVIPVDLFTDSHVFWQGFVQSLSLRMIGHIWPALFCLALVVITLKLRDLCQLTVVLLALTTNWLWLCFQDYGDWGPISLNPLVSFVNIIYFHIRTLWHYGYWSIHIHAIPIPLVAILTVWSMVAWYCPRLDARWTNYFFDLMPKIHSKYH